jgi:hypothetical protein
MPSESKDTISGADLKHGHVVAGVAAVKLSQFAFTCLKGILIRAPGGDDPTPNTDPIWIGSAAVTADSNVGTGGLPLLPGESLVLPIDNPSEVWVISTAATQDLAWFGV